MFSVLNIMNFFKGIDIKIYFGVVIAAVGFWLYSTYDIVSIKDSLIIENRTNQLENRIKVFQETLKEKDIEIHNQKVLVEQEKTKVEACKFEKDVIEFECNIDKEDFNETTIDPESNYLPF